MEGCYLHAKTTPLNDIIIIAHSLLYLVFDRSSGWNDYGILDDSHLDQTRWACLLLGSSNPIHLDLKILVISQGLCFSRDVKDPRCILKKVL